MWSADNRVERYNVHFYLLVERLFRHPIKVFHVCNKDRQKFFSNRLHYVVEDDCRSKLVTVVSGLPQGSVLVPQFFLLLTEELFYI